MTNSLTLRLSRRLGKLQLSGFMLIALLQRTPVLRLLASAESVWVGSSFGQVLKTSVVVASMLGAVDTLAGATEFVANPMGPADATVGTPFSAVFAYLGGAATVGSYSITGLPPGLSVPGSVNGTLNGTSGSITGTPTLAGEYDVSISAYDDPNLGLGKYGSVAFVYTIMVSDAGVGPAITSQPASLTVTPGQSAVFSVSATGDPTLTYQWRKDGAPINGAVGSTYTIPSTVSGDAGTYTVVVTNPVTSVSSSGAILTVTSSQVSPAITSPPASQTVMVGQPVLFSVTADGTAPLAFQWRKNGSDIAGATGATYTIAAAVSGDAGTYTVFVSNSVSSVTSNGAILTVNAASAAPIITTQPLNQTVNAGATVTFIAAATGNPAPNYQWQKNGVDIPGATSSSYTINGVTGNDSSNYKVIATNAAGSATSNPALLLVIVPPSNAVIAITVE